MTQISWFDQITNWIWATDQIRQKMLFFFKKNVVFFQKNVLKTFKFFCQLIISAADISWSDQLISWFHLISWFYLISWLYLTRILDLTSWYDQMTKFFKNIFFEKKPFFWKKNNFWRIWSAHSDGAHSQVMELNGRWWSS